MVLFFAVLGAPILALAVFLVARHALRRGQRRLAVAVVLVATGLEANAVYVGIRQVKYGTRADISPAEVPGTYVLLGQDARDEIVLTADGTFVRTAAYRGVTQRQQGRWRGLPNSGIEFDALEPGCLRTTKAPGERLQLREPDDVLCAGQGTITHGLFCNAGDGFALCLGGDGFEFLRE